MAKSLERKARREGVLFALPWTVGFMIFWLFPLVSSLWLSFKESTINNFFGGLFVGLENYGNVINDVSFGTDFVATLTNSLIDIPVIMAFSLFASVLLNQKMYGRVFFRAVFFMPVILAGAIMNVIFSMGAADAGLGSVLAGQMSFMASLIGENLISRLGIILWRSSVQILIFLAGLQSISSTIYEAAKIDGASPWETFWKITIPSLSPIIVLNLVYSIIDSFTEPTNRIIEMIKTSIFSQYDYGFASATSWLYFIIVLFVILLIFAVALFVRWRGSRRKYNG